MPEPNKFSAVLIGNQCSSLGEKAPFLPDSAPTVSCMQRCHAAGETLAAVGIPESWMAVKG